MPRPVKGRNGGTLHALEKGESGNLAGRPPKLLSTITAELKAKGYERATSNQVADAFETLMNVPQNELADMVKDEKAPMSLRSELGWTLTLPSDVPASWLAELMRAL